jgi:hypothetical protein
MTECYCDYDAPKVYRATIRRARKEHTCEECGRKINPKEKYEHVFGVWEYVGNFKTCDRCTTLRQWVKNNIPCFCWAHGNMIDDAEEAVKEATWRAGDEVNGLWFGFLRKKYSCVRLTR